MWYTCMYHNLIFQYLIIFSNAHITSQCSICVKEYLKKIKYQNGAKSELDVVTLLQLNASCMYF